MEYFVCKRSELEEEQPYFVLIQERTIGIFVINDQIHAIENKCPHYEGPVCLGDVTNRVRMELDENKKAVGDYLLSDYSSEEEINIVCPWHGLEFEMNSGTCITEEKLKLRKFETSEENGMIYVNL